MDDCLRKVGWVGSLLPNLEARLVIEDAEDADEGQPGELWIRGPSVMKVRLVLYAIRVHVLSNVSGV